MPGASASGSIDVISRTSVAGVLTNFPTLFLEGKKVSTKAAEEPSEGLMRADGRKRPERDRLRLRLPVGQKAVNAVGYNGDGLQRTKRSNPALTQAPLASTR